MLSQKQITSVDRSNMFEKILEFPTQLLRGWEIGEKNQDIPHITGFKHIVFSGMGGSAIGGDIVRSLLKDELPIPVVVNRSYRIPAYCDTQTLFVASSYSGSTEETLSALEEAQKRDCTVICIASGGCLGEIAKKNQYPLLLLPQGYPPRAALGYGLGILLSVFKILGIGKIDIQKLTDSVTFLKRIEKDWKEIAGSNNLPLFFARKIQHKIPLIYSSVDDLDAVGFRWKTQLNENSKTHAFYQPVSEMNHNEIVPWQTFPGTKTYFSDLMMILLRLPPNHSRIQLRMDIMKELVIKNNGKFLEIVAQGDTLLSQLLYLVFLGDWVSYYLAILYNVDPSIIQNIDYLKKQLLKRS